MPSNNVHWFPGHMKKALNEVEERIKLVDVVIELFDARAPLASQNPYLENIEANKKKLVVLTKADLADPEQTKAWENKLKNKFDSLLVMNLTENKITDALTKAVLALGKEKRERDMRRGMKPQPLKTMIVGIPNVGKSSLINKLAKRKAAGVQNKPGFTRGEQWIRVNQDFILLDTPGILPMNYDDQSKATNLALIGCVKEDILPNHILLESLLKTLKNNYPSSLEERYGIKEITTYEEVVKQVADRRKLLDSNGELDLLRSEALILKEFKDGKLGRITLEKAR
ncbi:MAG: ribosome biogenesis GTPase YlqF [Bacilli bacterium]|nr:ribosome biogenesis GTPase YlqF [Bacilli bacterium]